MPIPPIAITTFGGEVPAIDDRLLPDNAATDAINAWLFSGRIEPLHTLQPLHTMKDPAATSWFRMPIGAASIDYMVDSYWLEFENINVRVIRSPTPGQDDDGRFYWADGQYPKMLTGTMIKQMNPNPKGAWNSTTAYIPQDGVTQGGINYTCILGNTNQVPPNVNYWVVQPTPLKLGVPPPETAPVVTPTGGVSTTNVSVAYVYTWVTAQGEEGPPSPPSITLSMKSDASCAVTMTAPLTGDTANRQLTKTRIYRSIVSAQGIPTLYFVAEIPITTLSYTDDHAVLTDAKLINNEQLKTTTWFPPPADLQGLVGMPNGMIAGWRFNEVWFCEPYNPHAWPVAYVIAVEGNIVGLGVYNQSLIILCQGQPFSATGIHPTAMTLAKIQPLEACTSRLSIVNTPNGVLYSSPNGLINITPAGAVNLTAELMLKDQWYGILNLDTIIATTISQGYYAYSGPIPGVFQEDTFQDQTNSPTKPAFQIVSHFGTRPGAFISLADQRLGVTVLDPSPAEVVNLMQDSYNGETMVLRDGVVYLVDLRVVIPYARYRWRSKIFTLPYLQNLGAAKVYWTPPLTVPPTAPSYFRMFAGDHAQAADSGLPLRFEEAMSKSGQMFRLPSGYKAQYYQFEVEGEVVVNAIHCAQTAHELRQI